MNAFRRSSEQRMQMSRLSTVAGTNQTIVGPLSLVQFLFGGFSPGFTELLLLLLLPLLLLPTLQAAAADAWRAVLFAEPVDGR